jgi:hypothetical protein
MERGVEQNLERLFQKERRNSFIYTNKQFSKMKMKSEGQIYFRLCRENYCGALGAISGQHF